MTATRIKPRGESKSAVQAIDLKELQKIIEQAGSKPLSEADRAKLSETVNSLAWLQQQLAQKNVSIARLRSLFGLQPTEKTDAVLGRKSADPSTTDDGKGDDGGKGAEKPKKKRKGHGRNSAADYKGAQRVEVPHDSLKSGDPCPECPTNKRGKVYTLPQPSTLVRVTGQAPLQATVYELERLRCNLCGEVFTAGAPPGIGNKKYDAKAASMIGLLKYGSGMPFNRLQQLQGNLGIPLPAATQWDIVNQAAKELTPVYDEMVRQAAQGRLLHNDDTSMRVLSLRKEINEEQATGEGSGRTGIFLTNVLSELEEGHRIALYFTGRKHAGENLEDLLAHRAAELGKPMQMCDGLGHNLPKAYETLLGNCLVHARRKYVEVVDSFPAECRHVLATLRDVDNHAEDARTRAMSDEQRLRHHQEKSGPLMAALKEWMAEQFDQKIVEPNSALGSAIKYMTKRWDQLTLFLRVPGAPLDNNICERALKKAILHRRNSLFYKTARGAEVGDIYMALIHTAELTGANALKYLNALLLHSDKARDEPSRWMPWNYAGAASANDAGAGAAGAEASAGG